jgi:hypothetical protein
MFQSFFITPIISIKAVGTSKTLIPVSMSGLLVEFQLLEIVELCGTVQTMKWCQIFFSRH